jgi:hypothetical protein
MRIALGFGTAILRHSTVTLAPFGFGVADASKSVVRVEIESVIWTPAVRLKSNVAMVSMRMVCLYIVTFVVTDEDEFRIECGDSNIYLHTLIKRLL